eukprot:4313907-Pyramimonas_sp.AAC.1
MRGDDAAVLGGDDALSTVIKEMGEHYEIRVKISGKDPTDAQQAKLLNGHARVPDDENDGAAI